MLTTMVEPVGRKKEPLKPEPAPEAEEKARKPMILQVRGSDEFKEWYRELAEFDGLTDTALFDRSIRQYAKTVGFKKPAPPR